MRTPVRCAQLAAVCATLAGLAYGSTAPATALADHAAHVANSAAGNRGCTREGLVKVFRPQSGFNPLHASAAQLQRNGFPPRPGVNAPEVLIKAWSNAVSHAKYFTTPHPVCGSAHNYTPEYSGNWSGQTASNFDYNGMSFQSTVSSWVQPKVGNNAKYSNYNQAPTASLWTGLGDNSGIIQAGCSSISISSAIYKCWTEDYPQSEVWEGPDVHKNDTMYVQVRRISAGGNASYYMEDVSTGEVQSFENNAPYYDGTIADFIAERIEPYYMPNFGTTSTTGNGFEDWNNNWHSLTAGHNELWTMTSNCSSTGIVLAKPSALTGSNFDQQTFASSPVCN